MPTEHDQANTKGFGFFISGEFTPKLEEEICNGGCS